MGGAGVAAGLLSLFALLGIVDLWGKKRDGKPIARGARRAVLVLVLGSEALWVIGASGNLILGTLLVWVALGLAWLLF